ncbi:MAG: amidohydrolase family protein [Clostridia bacterium]|nr:amidohydrolase family protein [Clostridia bacterium]
MNYTLKNCVLLDGTKDMFPVKNATVWIKDEKIAKIAIGGADMPDSKVIDLNGMYLMPGLINLHVHMASSGMVPAKSKKPTNYKLITSFLNIKPIRAVYLKIMSGFAKQELYSGVTTLRSVGGFQNMDGVIRDRVNKGKIEGPRMLVANAAISVPGGHFAGSLATESASVEEACNDVRKIIETKPDLIKLMITGGVMDANEKGEPGAIKMSNEMIKAVCDIAHENGLKVAAHVECSEGVKAAVENGVDTIEHGSKIDDAMIEKFKERNAAMVCTISPALPYIIFDYETNHSNETAKHNSIIVLNNIIEGTKSCLVNDINVGLGTDTGCPFIRHYDTWRELFYFKKYIGVSSEYTLYTATLKNAEIAGVADITGSVEVGKYADLIVSKNNPLENFENLRNLEYVFTKGRMIKNPKIKKNKVSETELDKHMYKDDRW